MDAGRQISCNRPYHWYQTLFFQGQPTYLTIHGLIVWLSGHRVAEREKLRANSKNCDTDVGLGNLFPARVNNVTSLLVFLSLRSQI